MNISSLTHSIPAFALLCSWSDEDGLEEKLGSIARRESENLKQQSDFLHDQALDWRKQVDPLAIQHSFRQFQAARGTTADAVSRSGVSAQ